MKAKDVFQNILTKPMLLEVVNVLTENVVTKLMNSTRRLSLKYTSSKCSQQLWSRIVHGKPATTCRSFAHIRGQWVSPPFTKFHARGMDELLRGAPPIPIFSITPANPKGMILPPRRNSASYKTRFATFVETQRMYEPEPSTVRFEEPRVETMSEAAKGALLLKQVLSELTQRRCFWILPDTLTSAPFPIKTFIHKPNWFFSVFRLLKLLKS